MSLRRSLFPPVARALRRVFLESRRAGAGRQQQQDETKQVERTEGQRGGDIVRTAAVVRG